MAFTDDCQKDDYSKSACFCSRVAAIYISKAKTMHALRSIYIMILLVAVSSFFGCSKNTQVPSDDEVHFKSTTFSFDQGTYPSDIDLFMEYRVKPGDVMDILFQIRTWKPKEKFEIDISHTVGVKFLDAPELNEEQLVLPNGCIVLPYLGEVKVIGKSIPELTAELKGRYNGILRDPELYVTVPEFHARIKELKHDLHTAPRGLSRLVTVRPDGYVTFPLIGNFFVAHRTIPEINEMMNKEYGEYLPGLHVDLFLHKHGGAVITLLGEVNEPGMYNIMRPITVIESLALAKGQTSDAKLESVIVFRRHERRIVARKLNLHNRFELNASDEFFYLRPDDVVYIPRRRIAELAEIMQEIADIALFRGWYFGYSINDRVDWINSED